MEVRAGVVPLVALPFQLARRQPFHLQDPPEYISLPRQFPRDRLQLHVLPADPLHRYRQTCRLPVGGELPLVLPPKDTVPYAPLRELLLVLALSVDDGRVGLLVLGHLEVYVPDDADPRCQIQHDSLLSVPHPPSSRLKPSDPVLLRLMSPLEHLCYLRG